MPSDRFETAAGKQAQIDFAQFRTAFTRDPKQIVALWAGGKITLPLIIETVWMT
jgi:hypothetical protein